MVQELAVTRRAATEKACRNRLWRDIDILHNQNARPSTASLRGKIIGDCLYGVSGLRHFPPPRSIGKLSSCRRGRSSCRLSEPTNHSKQPEAAGACKPALWIGIIPYSCDWRRRRWFKREKTTRLCACRLDTSDAPIALFDAADRLAPAAGWSDRRNATIGY